MMLKIITSNPGKVKEYRHCLEGLGIEVTHLRVPYDEVQSSELEEVVKKGMAELKADGISDFIIDDSGLFIDRLNGFPGVWSAYVQKTIGNEGILKLMKDVMERGAVFKCCIGCSIGDKDVIVTGACGGVIIEEERGTEGFGYDPIFSHDGKRSFAEIPPDEKDRISHRGNAVELLLKEISDIVWPCGKP
ncbi:MAG: RdgB/HAM1 family non-canonical purine NTP pyrophosphatase [Candidatus Methanoplasma sp.]|jgi:XTP/dITP diphosphohydrolase|nr:RdgB/HAM1 family non-canonical purine NTP pyrophosphatase [Candidatus Methanoplasma sp.]